MGLWPRATVFFRQVESSMRLFTIHNSSDSARIYSPLSSTTRLDRGRMKSAGTGVGIEASRLFAIEKNNDQVDMTPDLKPDVDRSRVSIRQAVNKAASEDPMSSSQLSRMSFLSMPQVALLCTDQPCQRHCGPVWTIPLTITHHVTIRSAF